MELMALAIFAFALLMNAASPGPSIAALVSRVLVRGWRDVAPFVAAMWLGEAVWLTLAAAGLATLAERFHFGFVVIKYCGVTYLVYLAWKMWTAPVDPGEAEEPSANLGALRMFLAGLTVTLGNPKIMVFYLALLPTLLDLGGLTVLDWAALTATMLVVLASIDLAYVVMAARARRLLRSPRAIRFANRAGALAMGGAAAAIASR